MLPDTTPELNAAWRSSVYQGRPKIAVFTSFLDASTCRRLRGAMELGHADAAEILDGGAGIDEAARKALCIDVDTAALTRVEAALDAAMPAVAERCGVVLANRREGAGFIRYRPGGFYRRHRDRAADPSWPDAALRRLSAVLFLNSGDFTGGELVLYPGTAPVVIAPRAGTLVAFDAAMLHEVRTVAGGTRDVVVDWFY